MTSADAINVITTRPNNRATNLVEAINNLSTGRLTISAHHAPLMAIIEYYDQAFFDRLEQESAQAKGNSAAYNGVIFISGNAVDWAQSCLAANLWQRILACPLFAIGEQTASVLQKEINLTLTHPERLENKQRVTHPQQMNSEGLLNLPELSDVKGQRWLIIKGKDGRDKLKTGLQAGGATVHELSVYQRQLPDSSSQERIVELQRMKPIWLISSIQALKNLSQILNHQVQDCRIIISSDRIAEQAAELGFCIIAQAQDASDKQLVQSLKEYIGN